jgi:hypothetical protein
VQAGRGDAAVTSGGGDGRQGRGDRRLVPTMVIFLVLAAGVLAAGVLGPATWAAASRTTTALRTE